MNVDPHEVRFSPLLSPGKRDRRGDENGADADAKHARIAGREGGPSPALDGGGGDLDGPRPSSGGCAAHDGTSARECTFPKVPGRTGSLPHNCLS